MQLCSRVVTVNTSSKEMFLYRSARSMYFQVLVVTIPGRTCWVSSKLADLTSSHTNIHSATTFQQQPLLIISQQTNNQIHAMNDIAFNCRLNNMNQRAVSLGHPVQAAPEDMFSGDLAALKLRLQSMEASLNYLNTSSGERQTSRVQTGAAHSAGNLPSLPSELPSGPHYWQLFNSLRADVRGLDARVAEGEQNMSQLEDRIDSLDPSRFTPSSSNTTHVSMPWSPGRYPTSVEQQATDLPYGRQYQQSNPPWSPYHASKPSISPARYCSGAEATTWMDAPAGIAFRDREIVSRTTACDESRTAFG